MPEDQNKQPQPNGAEPEPKSGDNNEPKNHNEELVPLSRVNQLTARGFFTRDEIASLPSSQGFDPMIGRGGWNCRHEWVPYNPDPKKDKAA